jgi:fatty acyl-CoA reductase
MILKLRKEMKKLKTLIHVSTAYAFCQKNELFEKIYPMKETPEEVIRTVETMDDIELEK